MIEYIIPGVILVLLVWLIKVVWTGLSNGYNELFEDEPYL